MSILEWNSYLGRFDIRARRCRHKMDLAMNVYHTDNTNVQKDNVMNPVGIAACW